MTQQGEKEKKKKRKRDWRQPNWVEGVQPPNETQSWFSSPDQQEKQTQNENETKEKKIIIIIFFPRKKVSFFCILFSIILSNGT